MNYNESQKEAILHKDGPMLVLAGPGSGKTAVITQRTYELIHTHGVNPKNILVITFTKAAAQEMKQRFVNLSGKEHTGVTFGTFHAVFFMMLKYAYHLDAGNIVTEEKRFQLMREIIRHYNLEYQDENEFLGELFGEISQVKNARMKLEHFYSAVCGAEVFRKIFHDYAKQLAKHRLMDFDDMLTYTYELLSQREDILCGWQKKFAYILVDEFQDINQIQYDIVRMLAKPLNNLFAVGDDDQSIYHFRGSRPEIMLGFEQDFPGTRKVQLYVNYRSAEKIVASATCLIGHNEKRFKKNVSAVADESASLVFEQFEDTKAEYAYVVQEIKRALESGIEGKEIAVLCRTNVQPRQLLEQLLYHNIAFKTKDKIPNLYEHWIAKDLFAYLRIAAGSRKRADFLLTMNKPKRYIGRDSLTEATVDFKEWEKAHADKPWVLERIRQLKKDLTILNTLNPYAAINFIRKGIDYDSYLEEYASYRNIRAEDLFEVIDEIQDSAKGFKTFEDWYKHIEHYQMEMEEQAKRNDNLSDAVTISTLHSAKGLEFYKVFLVDVNEGLMPYKKALTDAEIEEERRLFYVGMTRAKRHLTLCSVKKLYHKKVELSRFIKESGLQA